MFCVKPLLVAGAHSTWNVFVKQCGQLKFPKVFFLPLPDIILAFQNNFYMSKKNGKQVNEEETVKVNAEVKAKVKKHVDKIGGKIGKFFSIAATEKLAREEILESEPVGESK